MNVLSLFDGMSCGRIALEQLSIPVEKYYASEIDKYAIQVSTANYPDIIQLGDVLTWREWDIDWDSIDLVTGGFPCQSWSLAGKQLGDKDERGKMFWVMLDIMQNVITHNPNAYYLMENVRMKKEFEDYITTHTENALPNVYKHMINSALVSAQNRVRFYWTNIPRIEQPKDRGIVLKDILENDAEEPMFSNIYGGSGEKKPREHFNKSITIRANSCGGSIPNIKLKDFDKNLSKMTTKDNKSFCLTSSYNGAVAWNSLQRKQRTMIPTTTSENDITNIKKGTSGKSWFFEQQTYSKDSKKTRALKAGGGSGNIPKVIETETKIGDKKVNWRKLTCRECEALQTVPRDYTNHVSNTQRYKMLGNGWTVEVIKHIFQNMDYKKGK